MSVRRSPTGSGLASGHSGSQPNLVSEESLLEFNDDARITLRNKRKLLFGEESDIREELSDIREQLAKMMTMISTLTNKQQGFMDKISGHMAEIKEEINEIKNVTKDLKMEQKVIKDNITNLESKNDKTEKTMEKLVLDVAKLKTTTSRADSIECVLSEIKEREERNKNVIITDIPEPVSLNKEERKSIDKSEVLRVTRAIDTTCPEPVYIFRLGKYMPGKNRPIKVCYQTQETVKSLLRNRNNLKLGTIKLFSDQTPQQQIYIKALKEELKQRVDAGENDLMIKYIRGIPKIVKIQPKN